LFWLIKEQNTFFIASNYCYAKSHLTDSLTNFCCIYSWIRDINLARYHIRMPLGNIWKLRLICSRWLTIYLCMKHFIHTPPWLKLPSGRRSRSSWTPKTFWADFFLWNSNILFILHHRTSFFSLHQSIRNLFSAL